MMFAMDPTRRHVRAQDRRQAEARLSVPGDAGVVVHMLSPTVQQGRAVDTDPRVSKTALAVAADMPGRVQCEVAMGGVAGRIDHHKMRETFRLARIAFHAVLDLRREGSAELDLCSVAAGRAGLYFEMQVSLWDYAAGALLVREAGGVCQDIRGAELPFDGSKPTILAGGSHAVMDFLKLTEGGK